MDIVDFIQKFFIYLLPGIFGVIIFNILNPHKERQYLIETVYALLLSFASFAIIDVIFGGIKKLFPCFVCDKINIISYVTNMDTEIPTENFLCATIAAVILVFILTFINSQNIIFKVARFIHITNRNDNLSVWEVFLENNRCVTLRDTITNNTYYGIIKIYSDNSDLREIYMNDVDVYNETGEHQYHLKDLYLSRNHNEFTLETFTECEDKQDEKE